MNGSIKPIQTRYAGHHFRSRLEARWAVFLDAIGIDWVYEPEGYAMDGVCYLPDLWLPQLDCFIEVKPDGKIEEESWKKAVLLASGTGKSVVVTSGIGRPECGSWKHVLRLVNGYEPPLFPTYYWMECCRCERFGLIPVALLNSDLRRACGPAIEHRGCPSNDEWVCSPRILGALAIATSHRFESEERISSVVPSRTGSDNIEDLSENEWLAGLEHEARVKHGLVPA